MSGCGDGGLIDALRVVHFEFEKGMLAFEIAAKLYGTPIAGIIERAEQGVAAVGARVSKSEAAKKLRAAYEEAAGLLFADAAYEEVQGQLLRSLEPYHRILFLTDAVWNPPCSPAAAPIHKLMVVHAKLAGKIAFLSGEVRVEPTEYVVRGKHFKNRDKTKVIPRHGATPIPFLAAVLEDQEVEHLAATQPADADMLADRHWTSPFPAVPEYPLQDFSSETFIKSRLPMVKALVRSFDLTAEVTRMTDHYEVTFQDEWPAMVRGKFFGVPVIVSTYPHPVPLP